MIIWFPFLENIIDKSLVDASSLVHTTASLWVLDYVWVDGISLEWEENRSPEHSVPVRGHTASKW